MSNWKTEAAIVAAGLVLAGLTVQQGIQHFVDSHRIVSVKGLAEMEVPANKVTWPLVSKSLGNAVYLSDSADAVKTKVMSAVTDPSRIKKDDPGHPDICVVSKYHKIFNHGEYENICESCKKGAIGCVACKKALAGALNDLLEPFREKRAYYEAHRDEVRDIILTGSEKANRIGNETVKEVKEAMHIYIGD